MFSFAANKTPQQQQQQPTTSGLSTSTSQPNFFGQPATAAVQPTTGNVFSFNKPAESTQATTGGGGIFGSSQPNTSGVFSFASKPVTTATPSLNTSTSFGTGLGLNKPALTIGTTSSPFGQTTTPATSGSVFSGFGTKPTCEKPATTAIPSIFGSTPAATTTGFSGFGANTTATQPATTSTGFFGTPNQGSTGGSLFNLGASKPATTSNVFGGAIGQQPTQAPTGPTSQIADQDLLFHALVNPQVFNDERDAIVAKWNQLQAQSGTGKLFYQNAALDVPKENFFNRFKTIGYSCRPTQKNEEGLVSLVLNKKEADVRAEQKNITTALHKIFNSEPALTVVIESIKATSEDKTELVFYVNQRVSSLTEQTNRIASSMVYQHLSKQEAPPSGLLGGLKTTPTIKQQLEQMGVVSCYSLVGMSDEEVKAYLENVPSGLNPMLWEQAKKNNPNTKKLMPVQIAGFSEINKRFRLQDEENKSQRGSLALISSSIDSLNDRNKLLRSKIEQFKARNDDLEQRTLKVMINYEIRRKMGMPLQDNEKFLLGLLESIQMELSSPINKEIQRQKLSEFADIVKSLENRKRQQQQLQKPLSATNTESASFDASSFTDIQKSLREQQKAFKSIIDVIQKDAKDLELMRKSILNEK